MSIEDKLPESCKLQQEDKESSNLITLDKFLIELQQNGIKTLFAEEITKQLNETGNAIVTRDYNCGIRISKSGSEIDGYKYTSWTTNNLEDPNHPLSQKFARRDIIIE